MAFLFPEVIEQHLVPPIEKAGCPTGCKDDPSSQSPKPFAEQNRSYYLMLIFKYISIEGIGKQEWYIFEIAKPK